jgi:hypothetical protein
VNNVEGLNASASRISPSRLNWRILLSAVLVALLLFLPIMVYGNDLVEMFYVFLIAPVLTLIWAGIVLLSAIRKKRSPGLSTFCTFPVFWIFTLALFLNSRELHWTTRWLLHSNDWKNRVVAQPAVEGELKHVEWDGWGFAGMDTTAYLVFDSFQLAFGNSDDQV